MANRRSIVSLQQFPIEVLTKIVQKAGKASSADYCNLRATCKIMEEAYNSLSPLVKNPCKIMEEASNSYEVLRSLCLSPLVKKPLCGLQHKVILDKCEESDNCAAFFVRRILTYFVDNDELNGMVYLNLAAIGEGDEEILEVAYLYGVMRFLHDDPLRGPFDEIAFRYWREDEEDLMVRVWKNLRKILHGITVEKKQVYVQSMRGRRPPGFCHILDMEIDCPDCFMYKRCMKFFYMNRIVAPDLH